MWNEHDVIQGCLKGDKLAFRQLYERFASRMLGVCYRYCKNSDDAHDVMQDGFVKVFSALQKFKQQSSLDTWVTRIMVNTSIDFYKKQRKFDFIEHYNFSDETDDDQFADQIDEVAEISEEQILELVEQLPDGCRIVFNLYVLENFTHREISEKMGISEGTSKSQLSRARQLLKEAFKTKKILE